VRLDDLPDLGAHRTLADFGLQPGDVVVGQEDQDALERLSLRGGASLALLLRSPLPSRLDLDDPGAPWLVKNGETRTKYRASQFRS